MSRWDFEESVLMPMLGDEQDQYRQECSDILLGQTIGNNGVTQECYRDGKVCFISILTVGFLDDYGRGNQLSKPSSSDLKNRVAAGFILRPGTQFCVLRGLGQSLNKQKNHPLPLRRKWVIWGVCIYTGITEILCNPSIEYHLRISY